MKKSSVCCGSALSLALLLLLPALSNRLLAAEGGEIFVYRPHDTPLKYTLNIKTHSELNTGGPRSRGGVFEDHVDLLSLTKTVAQTDEGLLDLVLAVDAINEIPHAPTRGFNLEREQIVGNSQRTRMSLLGEVREATGLPHFASPGYYFGIGHATANVPNLPRDGVPFDMYRVLLMLHPQFPLRLLVPGDTWTVRDKVSVTKAASGSELGAVEEELKMDIRRTITYTLVGAAARKGYQTAHIRFEAQYEYDASMINTALEHYGDGTGEDEGEVYFAPAEGVVVDAYINSKPVENKSEGGIYMGVWVDAKTFLFSDVPGQRSIPLKWFTDKTISFELAADAAKRPSASR